jgi:hypothetical protein
VVEISGFTIEPQWLGDTTVFLGAAADRDASARRAEGRPSVALIIGRRA